MCRRMLSLFLILMLLCPCAQAQTHTFSGLFSLSCDENVYTADTSSWMDECDENSRWLMTLSADAYLFDVTLSRVEGWEHVSLTDPSAAMTGWYLDRMSADGFEHLETFEAGGVVFGIFRAAEEGGEYLLGETMVNGWAIGFCACYNDPERPTDDELLNALKSVLQTYQPCR